VHELLGVRDDRAERLRDRLVPEADAEERLARRERRLDDGDDTPASAGLPGPAR
jgi:hypothetical protein